MTRKEYLEKLLSTTQRFNKEKSKQTATPTKYPQGYFRQKRCKKCGKYFMPKAPSEQYCSDYCKNYGVIEAYYKRIYGLTIKEYLDLAEKQNFVCCICGKENFAMGECHSGVLVVDHNHKTGQIRGLLCHNCNRALGLFQDDIEKLKQAISYLKGVTTIPKGSTLKRVETVATMNNSKEIV